MYLFKLVFLPRYVPRSRIARSYSSSFLVFWETSTLFSTVAATNLYSHQPCIRIHFSPYSHQHLLFDDSPYDTCVSHCGFLFAFPWWLAMLSIYLLIYLLAIWILEGQFFKKHLSFYFMRNSVTKNAVMFNGENTAQFMILIWQPPWIGLREE